MIRNGATLIETVGDILESLQGWQRIGASVPDDAQATLNFAPIAAVTTEPEHVLLELLKERSLEIDQLVDQSDLPLSEVLSLLTDFEINGNVSRQGGLWLYRKA